MVTELVLVRHGESEGNVAAAVARAEDAEEIRVPARDADVRLTELGRQQAVAAGAGGHGGRSPRWDLGRSGCCGCCCRAAGRATGTPQVGSLGWRRRAQRSLSSCTGHLSSLCAGPLPEQGLVYDVASFYLSDKATRPMPWFI